MIKDKIKKPKEITDKSNIIKPNKSDITQCPKCLKLSHIGESHKCEMIWSACSICGMDLHKKEKSRMINGKKYMSLGLKKYFRLIDSLICYNCAIRIVRMVKDDSKNLPKV